MYKDLSLKEKSELFKLMVSNGITDINEIERIYNSYQDGGNKISADNLPESQQYAVTTPDGQRKVFNSKQEASDYVTANTPKGYSLYDITNYGTNIDKGQTAILNRNTEREIEKATKQEELAKARLATIQQNKEASKEMLSYMPVIGDGMDLYQLGKDAYNGNYLNAGIGLGLLALPNVIEKPIKYVGKSIKKLFTKANKKSNVKFTDNFDINKNNKSYEELAEEYTDSWFDLGIKSSKDINAKNLQNITDDEWDKLYNEAIKNNDVEETQRLRDLHFKAKAFNSKTIDNYGLPIHNYHGGQKGINVFFNSKNNLNYKNTKHQGYSHPETRIGIYFSPDKEIAKNYKRTYGKKGEIYDTYLKMDNPYIQKYSTTLLNRVKNLLFRDKYFDPAVIRDYRLNKELKGFDGVSHGDFENVVWDNKNIKLADPITYDDNGKIIPLSKRDDFTNPDIRYSWLLPTIGVGTGLSLMNNENNQYKYGGPTNKFDEGGLNITLPEVVVSPRNSYYTYTGKETVTPTWQEFAKAKQNEARDDAYLGMLSQGKPIVPEIPNQNTFAKLINVGMTTFGANNQDVIKVVGKEGPENVFTCINTVTGQYDDCNQVSGNITFSKSPSKYGFKEVNTPRIGDLIQFTDNTGTPHHAAMVTGFDENGEPIISYSDGGWESESMKYDKDTWKKDFEGDTWKYYTFIGNRKNASKWREEYDKKFKNKVK